VIKEWLANAEREGRLSNGRVNSEFLEARRKGRKEEIIELLRKKRTEGEANERGKEEQA
jgi:hypothetical protein